MSRSPDYSLYLVTDDALAGGRSVEWIVAEAVRGGVTCPTARETRGVAYYERHGSARAARPGIARSSTIASISRSPSARMDSPGPGDLLRRGTPHRRPQSSSASREHRGRAQPPRETALPRDQSDSTRRPRPTPRWLRARRPARHPPRSSSLVAIGINAGTRRRCSRGRRRHAVVLPLAAAQSYCRRAGAGRYRGRARQQVNGATYLVGGVCP